MNQTKTPFISSEIQSLIDELMTFDYENIKRAILHDITSDRYNRLPSKAQKALYSVYVYVLTNKALI